MKVRGILAVFGALALSLVAAGSASASVGISTSLTMPTAATVGSTGNVGSFTVRNTNTPPNNTESNTATQMRLAPSCGTTGTVANLCSMPDTGVISVGSTGSGRAATACAGVTFSVSAPDASGIVTFTRQGGALVLPPPSGTPGDNECTVDFTFSVLKSPTIDAAPATPGIQTRVNFLATTQGNISGLVVNSTTTLQMTIARATPAVSLQTSQNVIADTIAATATITDAAGVPAPTGTVTFTAYGPNDATCSGVVLNSSTNPVTAGTATSSNFAVSLPGTYRFKATYNGDANHDPVSTVCNAAGANVVVGRRAVADFDGNGTTDASVYRNGGWYVNGQATTFLGLAGFIPVPADYDGDGDTDRAVYNDGAWYVAGQPTTYLGLAGYIPVPGDYDGNGDAERAVYNGGAWYVEGLATQFLGLAGDIPVPGDYNGDGDTERAVFRDGAWYVEGLATVFHGLPGDIPVPGDYDGDGDTDRAVYRDGAWYVHNQATQFWGLAGDVPVPGDYDGNGTTDRAVFRNGAWYIQSQGTVFHGLAGDIPLPLPQAIYRAKFGGGA